MPVFHLATRHVPVVAAWLLVPALAHADLTLRPQSPLPIPTFTCADANPVLTTSALTNPGEVLNTTATSATDRGNQPRWAYAFDPANPGSHTVPAETAPNTETIPGAYIVDGTNNPNSAPGDLGSLPTLAWQYFSGREIFAYSAGTVTSPQLGTSESLQRVGFYRNNPTTTPTSTASYANQIRYFRYQFYLAPEVNPADFVLTLNGLWVDDYALNAYINGAGVGLSAATGPRNVALGGASTGPNWQTGLNTLTIATLDTAPSSMSLRLPGATASNCAASQRTLALSLSVDTPVRTPEQAAVFSGKATATPSGAAAQPLPEGTAITLTITGPDGFTETVNATVTGPDGEYTATRPAGLAVGNYTVVAHLSEQSAVVSLSGDFTVRAGVDASAGSVQSVPTLSAGALALLGALLGGLGLRQRRARGS